MDRGSDKGLGDHKLYLEHSEFVMPVGHVRGESRSAVKSMSLAQERRIDQR